MKGVDKLEKMELSPKLYQYLIRPRFFTKIYIGNVLKNSFNFNGKKVLDFGSGTGSNSTLFSPKDYVGIDPDNQRIDYAKRFFPNYEFHVLRDKTLPIPDKSIDIILVVAVLHHISSEELPCYINDFLRILKPHGRILVIEPCLSNNFSFNNWFMKTFDKGKYIRDKDSYLRLFSSHYDTKIIKRFNKIFYNEIFFSAIPN